MFRFEQVFHIKETFSLNIEENRCIKFVMFKILHTSSLFPVC